MRVLLGPGGAAGRGEDGVDDTRLAELYAPPTTPWLRVNMVTSLDGAATGESGLSRSINNDVDRRVFDLLRATSDAVVVGAGTARDEGYRPLAVPLVLVTRRGEVPERLRGAEPGRVRLATVASSPGLDAARDLLGAEHVYVAGDGRDGAGLDLAGLREQLVADGMRRLLCEGGPHLLGDLLDQGVADELTTTIVPRAVVGDHPRITSGAPADVPLDLRLLMEQDGTLLGRWFVRHGPDGPLPDGVRGP